MARVRRRLALLLLTATLGWLLVQVRSGRHPVRHAVALGVVLTEGGLLFALAFGGEQPALIRFGPLALILPLTTLGGALAPRIVGPEEPACPSPTPSPSSS